MCQCDHNVHDIDNTGKLNIANADLIPCAHLTYAGFASVCCRNHQSLESHLAMESLLQMALAPDLQPDGGNCHAWHGLERRIRREEQPR